MSRFLGAAVCCALLAALASRALALGGLQGYSPEYDIRAFAQCDGSTNVTTGVQAAVDYATTAGGSVIIPSGVVCVIGGAGVELKSNVTIRCERGGKLKAHSTAPTNGIIYSTSTSLADVAIEDCDLDLNGKAISAVALTGDAVRAAVRNNYVHGIATGSGTGVRIVRVDCNTVNSECAIEGNFIVGSGTDARDDDCLYVEFGGFLGAYPTAVQNNRIASCGGSCLNAFTGSGLVTGNDFSNCLDYGIYGDTGFNNGVITGNMLSPASSVAAIYLSSSNIVVEANKLLAGGGLLARTNGTIAGLQIIGNYLSSGIVFDAIGHCATGCSAGTGTACTSEADADGGTCGTGCPGTACVDYGVFDHNTIFTNLSTYPIDLENTTHLVVSNNTLLSDTAKGSRNLRITNRTTSALGAIAISGNLFVMDRLSGTTDACLDFDDIGGGGFKGVAITNNYCGGNSSTSNVTSQGFLLTNAPDPFDNVTVAGNVFNRVSNNFVNWGTAAVRASLGWTPEVQAKINSLATNGNATLADITGLTTFQIRANRRYVVSGRLSGSGSLAGTDIQLAYDASGTPGTIAIGFICSDTVSTVTSAAVTADATGVSCNLTTNTSQIMLSGYVVGGSTDQTADFMFASVGSGTTTLDANGYVMLTLVND